MQMQCYVEKIFKHNRSLPKMYENQIHFNFFVRASFEFRGVQSQMQILYNS